MQSEDQIIRRITQIIAAFWILMKIISLRLWIKDRNYPLVPILDMPAIVHIILLSIFFVLAAWLVYKPDNKYVIVALIFFEAINLLGDQNRLQPWHYQYLFTFFAIAANYKRPAKALQAITLILASTYLFSGLSKINGRFIDFIWSVHILKRFLHLPAHLIHLYVVQLAGYTIPLIEICGAIGLMHKKTIKIAAYFLIAMHIFLLLFLGPLGLNYNIVVWPWNVLMIMLLYLMFLKNQIQLKPLQYKSAANFAIAVFWIVLPVAGLFGYWDKFLSSGMYSGRGKLQQFYFEDRAIIPKELQQYALNSKSNASARLVLTEWCVAELNVAAVSEPRLLKSITHQLNERYAAQSIKFRLSETEY